MRFGTIADQLVMPYPPVSHETSRTMEEEETRAASAQLRACNGNDIIKAGRQRKNRYLLALPGLVSLQVRSAREDCDKTRRAVAESERSWTSRRANRR